MKNLTKFDFYIFSEKNFKKSIGIFDYEYKIGSYSVFCGQKNAKYLRSSEYTILIIGEYIQADLESSIGALTLDGFCSLNDDLSVKMIYEYLDTLAGHYICLFWLKGDFYIIPDATSSLPVFYQFNNSKPIISSVEMLLDSNEDSIKNLNSIIDYLPPEQVLPYDLCITPGVRCLLPNHYLHVNEFKSVRRNINIEEDESISISEAATKSIKIISAVAQYFSSNYLIKCPLTGGLDSRVVALALKKFSNNTNEAYTFQHNHLSNTSPDILLPPIFAKKLGFKHQKIFESNYNKDNLEKIWVETIAYPKLESTINNLSKIRSVYPANIAIAPGDIIGQIGKSSVGGCISNRLFSPRILRSKTHYYSSKGLDYERAYLKELSNSKGALSDFYAWEIRCGKWATRTSIFYRRAGVISINIFNCTNLIKLWCTIPRSIRVSGLLHQELIKQLSGPDFDDFRTNINHRSLRSKSIAFYLASLVKFYYERMLFKRNL